MIEINNVELKFNERQIFSTLNIEISEGEFTVVYGKSGTGKTSLLHLVYGILLPNKGSVSVLGRQPGIEVRSRISYLMQSHPVPLDERVGNYVVGEGLFSGKKKSVAKELADNYLEMIGIGVLKKKRLRELSGGERQRVALCGELVKENSILLLDEPTGSIDAENSRHILSALREANSKGTTIMCVSHDPSIRELGNSYVIRNGGLEKV